MVLAFPRSVFMEMFLNGWTDVTSYVQQTNPVTITRGRANEQGKIAPSKLTARMKNNTGDMSPSNPMGEFYPLLNRNVPLRWGLSIAADSFGRSVTNGWGNTDTGEAWTNTGNGTPLASDFQVTGTVGTQSVPATVTYRRSYLASLAPYRDCEVRVTLTSVGFTDVTGGALEPANVFVRGTDTPSMDAYLARVTIAADQSVTVGILRISTGLFVGSTVTVPGLTYTGQPLTVVMQAEDQTIRVKVYDSSGSAKEPLDWHTTAYEATGLTSGYVGVRSGIASGNTNTKPVVFSYDNFTVRVIRVHGELADLKPRWDESHNIKWTELEAAGILRRLQQGNSPLRSALHRAMLRSPAPPFGYWPMEDGKDATSFAPAIGAAPLKINFAPNLSSNDDFACSDRLPILNDAFLVLDVPAYSNPNNALQTRILLLIPDGNAVPNNTILFTLRTSGSMKFWDVVYYTASNGSLGLNAYDQQLNLVVNTGATLAENNGRPERIILDLAQNGANVDWTLTVGPVPTDIDSGSAFGTSGTITSKTFGLVDLFMVAPAVPLNETVMGHLTFHNAITSVLVLRNELGAYAGERAIPRFTRLCSEEGLTSSYIGDPLTSAKMGPQRARKLVDLLGECALAGDLYESRASGNLVLRDGSTLYGQTPAATLDYSAKQVSAPLQPGADDQATRNDITVKRTRGSEYRVEQATGPLNVQNPGSDPDAAGRYDTSVEVNVHSDDQLPDIANALLSQGTVKEDRYPKIRVNLAATDVDGNADLEAALLAADIDDRVVVENLSLADIFEPIDQLARGYTEVFRGELEHEITFNAAPYSPFRSFILDTSRLDTDTTTLAEALDTTETGIDITPGDTLWTTSGAEFPFDIAIAGERMTVTNCTGAGPTQTLTVTRSVNGVVKTHSTGDAVRLADPVYLG